MFIEEVGAVEAAETLLSLLRGGATDPLGQVDKLVRKRPNEDAAHQRRRLREILSVVATRLRRELPESETLLRSVVEALGSLGSNANPGILFSELVLTPIRQ